MVLMGQLLFIACLNYKQKRQTVDNDVLPLALYFQCKIACNYCLGPARCFDRIQLTQIDKNVFPDGN